MDWTEQLKAFRDANPDLPEGPDMPDSELENTHKAQPRLDIFIERKGRGGKTATLVTGWVCSQDELLEIASKLKSSLGTGGSARGGDILIQGDRRAEVLDRLTAMGYKARII
ncbi:MAG: translation initiation factor [Paramuribaculum sp.]|nr:translation initiation factor [Paramuribaculum sp.]